MIEVVRNGRRKRNMSLQYGLIAFIVAAVFAVLSTTVFFNIENALVVGSSVYTADEIIEASGIKGGDNMIRKNLGRSARDITSGLIYVETAEIRRRLPSSVEITVTPCVETASLEREDGFIIVSAAGKVLRYSESPAEGTRIFYGADPDEELELGNTFRSADENKTEVIFELMEKRDGSFAGKVTSYDVRDRLNISCLYDNRIEVELGVITDIDYKFRLANEIITTQLANDAEGRLKNFNKAWQFLSKDDLEQIDEVYESNINTEETTLPPETETEESGTESTTKLNFE